MRLRSYKPTMCQSTSYSLIDLTQTQQPSNLKRKWSTTYCLHSSFEFERLPVRIPAAKVPTTGVENLSLTCPKILNINPSDAIAYIILGNGNIAPNKLTKPNKVNVRINLKHIWLDNLIYLAHNPNIPPIVTIHLATSMFISSNACGIGALISFILKIDKKLNKYD